MKSVNYTRKQIREAIAYWENQLSMMNESYVIDKTLYNQIWSRAGNTITTISELDVDIHNPIFLSRSPSRTSFYLNDKHAPVVTFIKLKESAKLCNLLDRSDIESVLFDGDMVKLFERSEPYFSRSSATNSSIKLAKFYSREFDAARDIFKKYCDVSSYSICDIVSLPAYKFDEIANLVEMNLNDDILHVEPGLDKDIIKIYIKLFSNVNYLTNSYENIRTEFKGLTTATHIEFMQYVLHYALKEGGYQGYYCKEINRNTGELRYDTLAIIDRNCIDEILGNVSAQYYVNSYQKFNQNPNRKVNYDDYNMNILTAANAERRTYESQIVYVYIKYDAFILNSSDKTRFDYSKQNASNQAAKPIKMTQRDIDDESAFISILHNLYDSTLKNANSGIILKSVQYLYANSSKNRFSNRYQTKYNLDRFNKTIINPFKH